MLDDAFRAFIEEVVRRVVREELSVLRANTQAAQPDDMLTIAEVARIASVSINTVRSWLDQGLQAHHSGGVVRIRRDHLADFLSRTSAPAVVDPHVHAAEILSRRRRKE